MFCPECGSENPDDARFRGACGKPMGAPTSGPPAARPHVSKVIDAGSETIDRADLLIAIIGPRRLESRNADGALRLHLDDDYVRLEIESALAKPIPVVPVLVDDAPMPGEAQLPASIAPMAYLNALFIPRDPYFHAGVDKLIEEIEVICADKTGVKRRFCTGCGTELKSNQKFCTGCGRPVSRA